MVAFFAVLFHNYSLNPFDPIISAFIHFLKHSFKCFLFHQLILVQEIVLCCREGAIVFVPFLQMQKLKPRKGKSLAQVHEKLEVLALETKSACPFLPPSQARCCWRPGLFPLVSWSDPLREGRGEAVGPLCGLFPCPHFPASSEPPRHPSLAHSGGLLGALSPRTVGLLPG